MSLICLFPFAARYWAVYHPFSWCSLLPYNDFYSELLLCWTFVVSKTSPNMYLLHICMAFVSCLWCWSLLVFLPANLVPCFGRYSLTSINPNNTLQRLPADFEALFVQCVGLCLPTYIYCRFSSLFAHTVSVYLCHATETYCVWPCLSHACLTLPYCTFIPFFPFN